MAGRYEFCGLTSTTAAGALFPSPTPSGSAAERVGADLATHALVFQYTGLGRGGKRIQRVVGVHPVQESTADELHELLWETIRQLKVRAKLSVCMVVCDGAASNRLLMKMSTSDYGLGTPNAYVRSWCWRTAWSRAASSSSAWILRTGSRSS